MKIILVLLSFLFVCPLVLGQTVLLQKSSITWTEFSQIVDHQRQYDERKNFFYFDSIVYNEVLTEDQKKSISEKSIDSINGILDNAFKSGDMVLFESISRSIEFHKPSDHFNY